MGEGGSQSDRFSKLPSQAGLGGISRKDKMLRQISKGGVNKQNTLLILGSLLMVVAGVVTGWFLSGSALGSDEEKTTIVASGGEKSLIEAGLEDESTFRDSVEGKLVEGGIEGEGTHYLDRDLGPDKYVYLTSTVIDLQSFVGKKVKVWGETISAQNAGWLMDVGKLKVIE